MASIIYDSAFGGTCYEGVQLITLSSGLETRTASGSKWDLIILPTGQIEVYFTYPNGVQRPRYTSNIGCHLGEMPSNAQMVAGTLILQGLDGLNYAEAVNGNGLPPVANSCMVLTATGHLQIGCPSPTCESDALALIASGFSSPWWDYGSFIALGGSFAASRSNVSVQVTNTITVNK